MMLRWTWDATWIEVAKAVSRRSRCVRSQVGCVIVSDKNRVCSVSYNGPPAGLEVDGTCDGWCPRAKTGGSAAFYDDCHSSHAEVNGLIMANRSDYEGGTMYVTRVPCYTCAKIIGNSGIEKVVYCISDDDLDREPERSLAMLIDSGLTVLPWYI